MPAVTDLNFIETDTQWSDYDFLSSFDEFLNNKYYNVVLYRIMNKIQSNQKLIEIDTKSGFPLKFNNEKFSTLYTFLSI